MGRTKLARNGEARAEAGHIKGSTLPFIDLQQPSRPIVQWEDINQRLASAEDQILKKRGL